jgi:hypothetical protein
VKQIGEIKVHIEKKNDFWIFGNKLKKEIINITKFLYLVPISSQKHVWMIRNVFHIHIIAKFA